MDPVCSSLYVILIMTCPLVEHVRLNPKGGDLCPDRLHRGENLVKGCIGANVQIVPSDLGIGVQGSSNHQVAGSCRNVPQDSQRLSFSGCKLMYKPAIGVRQWFTPLFSASDRTEMALL